MSPILPIDIWSDVVCPWCYVGKRRLETALQKFSHRNAVRITWHPFELDPSAPRSYPPESTYAERLGRKYGKTTAAAQAMLDQMVATAAKEGIVMDFSIARPGNTLDAHRLLTFALSKNLQNELKERLLRASFTEGQSIGDRATLAHLASEVGLEETACLRMLESDQYKEDVRTEETEARKLKITGVPFFVMGRTYAIGGAQSSDILLKILEKTWSEGHTEIEVEEAPSCDADGCRIASFE